MVYVHLSDEEKLQVLLIALAIFLVALLAAVCLAGNRCPLHRWMLERHLSQRRQLLTATNSFMGPPPAYDQALRAARLQPLAGGAAAFKTPADSASLEEPSLVASGSVDGQCQLQLGDYFHQPRDEQLTGHPIGVTLGGGCGRGTAPVPISVRLWVKLLEPGELVERIRAHNEQARSSERRLSRQLSIPQLFGSLVGLAQLAGPHPPPPLPPSTPAQKMAEQAATNEPDSLASSNSSSSDSQKAPSEENTAPPASQPDGPIESRVLHMNVGSFSYAQEGGVASAKKHSQLNRLHFSPPLKQQPQQQQQAQQQASGESKLCQLVVSVCDLENVLASSLALERGCAFLASSSTVFVHCEIIPARSKSARLLAYPLRALQTGPPTHTFELAASSAPDAGPPAEPADSQASVVFATLPRPFAGQLGEPDLAQLDSVFVSPILHRSHVLEGQLRVRVKSQCKHLNGTCLAEIKLPLKHLLRSENLDNLVDVPIKQAQLQADMVLNNVLANLESATSGEPLADTLREDPEQSSKAVETLAAAEPTAKWLAAASGSLEAVLGRLDWGAMDSARAEHERRAALHCERAMLVSHWLGHVLAPAYECRPVLESCGRILLGLTYLPTSNRLVFNAHRASLDNELTGGRQLIKSLRLRSSTGYLLRFMMVLNGRVVRRKQTAISRRPEWDSQEPITFDLVSAGLERPVFLVALVVRDAGSPPASRRALGGSMQNLRGRSTDQSAGRRTQTTSSAATARVQVQSEPESAVRPPSWPTARGGGEWPLGGPGRRKRDLVLGHLTLGEEVWRVLRAQPRKQLVRQLSLY